MSLSLESIRSPDRGLARLLVFLAGFCLTTSVSAQETWGGKTLNFQRTVVLPAAGHSEIVVSEFFTHGELQPDGRNLAVYEGNRLVSWQVLQCGPGDFCRLGFQTNPSGKVYRIYYGGPASTEKPLPWEPSALLLQTRHWKPCDLRNAASVRNAFSSALPFGADFVPTVSHRYNPFHPDPGPFLSRYQGTLQIATGGRYTFYTSSQDCSFLFIDNQQVVAAPGHHRPVHDARIKGEVQLTAGPHSFEYLHAAQGSEACMAAAWQSPRAGKLEPIPPRAFDGDQVVRLPATALAGRAGGNLPDFMVFVVGDVPLAESDHPLIRVQFRNTSARRLMAQGKVKWDFGDGQKSLIAEPEHVFLRPGLYTVTLSMELSGKTLATANQVPVSPAVVLQARKGDQLGNYIPDLDRYDVAKLPLSGVVQLVRAFEQANHLNRAAKAGLAALQAERKDPDEEAARALARLVGPMLRDQLDHPTAAAAVWQAAARLQRREQPRAECEIEAADILLNDVLQRTEAKKLLDAALGRVARSNQPALTSRFQRVLGDWHARGGEREPARTAYDKASASLGSAHSTVEDNARRGAYSRSAEAFLRDKELDRALQELRHWQDQFPGDKFEGYLSLLQAQYWLARAKPQLAMAVAGDLTAVNPDSPYADRLAFLAAECEETLGRRDRAQAAFKTFLTDYPGSPLVENVKQKLAELARPIEDKKPARPTKPTKPSRKP